MSNKKRSFLALFVSVILVVGLLSGCLGSTTAPSTPAASGSAPAASGSAPATASSSAPAGKAMGNTANAELVIRFSNSNAETVPTNVAMETIFGPEIEQKSGGKISYEIYHSGQLADDQRAVELVRNGQLEMAASATSWCVGAVKELGVLDVPFVFLNYDAADKFLDGEGGKALAEACSRAGIRLVGLMENGFRHLTNSKKEIKDLAGIKGIKIRVMDNPYHIKLWQLLGANPTAMARTELFSALQQKVVDAQENPIPDFFGSGIHELTPYISLTGHIYNAIGMWYSKSLYDGYTDEQKKLVDEIGAKTGIEERTLQRKAAEDETVVMKNMGCTITEITDAAKLEMKQASLGVADMVKSDVGADFYDNMMKIIDEANNSSTK